MFNNNLLIEVYDSPVRSAIEEAISIQNEFAIAHDLIARGENVAEHGALISAYVPEDIKAKINKGAVLYLARKAEGKPPLGYLFQVTGSLFHEQFPGSRIGWHSSILEDKYSEVIKAGKFIYLAQIGVELEHHGRGVADGLLEIFDRFAKGILVVCSIMREPISNPRSKAFFNKHGYQDAGIFYKQTFGGFKSSTSDLLLKDHSK